MPPVGRPGRRTPGSGGGIREGRRPPGCDAVAARASSPGPTREATALDASGYEPDTDGPGERIRALRLSLTVSGSLCGARVGRPGFFGTRIIAILGHERSEHRPTLPVRAIQGNPPTTRLRLCPDRAFSGPCDCRRESPHPPGSTDPGQIWPPFPASDHYVGSQGPIRGATGNLARPTPWILDISGPQVRDDVTPRRIAEAVDSLSQDRCDWIAGMSSPSPAASDRRHARSSHRLGLGEPMGGQR